MDTNRIEQFCVIVETGNLRKAAEILNISHSGLSKSMKALEEELGYNIFLASGRGIIPSDEGKRLYSRSQKFLEEYRHLIAKQDRQISTPLRIGSFETFTSFFIGPLLKKYLSSSNIEIHELVPGRLEEALVLNKIDVGITYEPIPRKGVEYIKVASLFMGAFAKKGLFTDDDLSTLPFITPVTPLEGAPSGVKGRDGWPDEKFSRNIKYRVDLLATGLEIARQGLGAIFIPRFVARLHNERATPDLRIEALKMPRGLNAIKREVFIIKRESSVEDTVIRQIAKALRDICSED